MIGKLLIIAFLIYSILTPFFVQIINYLFRNENSNNYAMNSPQHRYFDFQTWFQDVNVTAFFFSWFFIILVLFPYVIFYLGLKMPRLGFLCQFSLFLFLMLVAGLVIVPWGFVSEFFLLGRYPQKVILLVSLSVFICPMVISVINKHVISAKQI